ncbi:hypothetical protein, partial [Streptomyces albicerus]|uniref:hypothetical protein n=1 Tax=Streptomyces albicerus TaxID=2569859 RepID=UPI001CEC28D4
MRLRIELHEPEPDENQAKHVEKVGANQHQTPSQWAFRYGLRRYVALAAGALCGVLRPACSFTAFQAPA